MAEDVKQAWPTLFGVGVFLLLLGLGVLFNLPTAGETATNIVIGLIAIAIAIAGFAALGTAFFAPEKSGWGRVGSIILGLIYLALAGAIWANPDPATNFLTMVAAALFIVAGIVKFFVALTNRSTVDHWGLMAIVGIITFFFGVFLLAHWPEISVAFIGLYVALEVIIAGIVMIASGLALRH